MAYLRTGMGTTLSSMVKNISAASSLIRPVNAGLIAPPIPGTALTPNPTPPPSGGLSTKAKIFYGLGIAGLAGLGFLALKKRR